MIPEEKFEVASLCDRYTDEDCLLPCDVTLGALSTFTWLRCFYFRESDLSRDQFVSFVRGRPAFLALRLEGFSRFWTFIGVQGEIDIDSFQYLTLREM